LRIGHNDNRTPRVASILVATSLNVGLDKDFLEADTKSATDGIVVVVIPTEDAVVVNVSREAIIPLHAHASAN